MAKSREELLKERALLAEAAAKAALIREVRERFAKAVALLAQTDQKIAVGNAELEDARMVIAVSTALLKAAMYLTTIVEGGQVQVAQQQGIQGGGIVLS